MPLYIDNVPRKGPVPKGEKAKEKFSLARSIGFDGDKVCAEISKQRREWQQHRDVMLMYQKECAKDKDYEGAKFFKEEASWAMKHYRSACLLVPYVCPNPPGDCPYRDLYEVGPELHSYLVYFENLCIMKASQ